MVRSLPLLHLLTLLLWYLCVTPAIVHAEPVVGIANENVATFLANDERLTEFQRLWDRLGVSAANINANSNATRQTLLAVTNEGWNEWATLVSPESAPLYLNNNNPLWREHLRHLLQFHVIVTDALTVEQIFDGSREGLETLAQFTLQLDQVNQVLQDTTPVTAIVDANNLISSSEDDGAVQAMIHILDQVVEPPYLTINLLERLLMNNDEDLADIFAYTTMANLALFAGLDDQINEFSEGGMTLLVPPNRRFNRAQLEPAEMLTEARRNYTRDFVLAHMVRGNYDTARITTEIQSTTNNPSLNQSALLLQSELGTNLWISMAKNQLRFQSREVLMTNQVARNGIFHVLDLPLFPPYISDVVEFTGVAFLETEYDTSDCFRFFTEALLNSTDVAGLFNATSLTMFCPNAKAFETFHKPTYTRLLEPMWIRHATEFLLNQITSPAISMEDLLQQVPSNITMLNGMTYELRQSGPRVRLRNTAQEQSRTVFGDFIALDGYVHIMDSVLTPTAVSNNLYDHAVWNADDFSLVVENIDFVQLTNIVARDIPLTWLAPNNAAFRQVQYSPLDLGEILKRHFFRGLLFCDVIANQTTIEAVNGEVLNVELQGVGPWGLEGGGKQLYVEGARLYECDTLATNGVFHAIDRVIGVDFETAEPSISPAPTFTMSPTRIAVISPTVSPTTIPVTNIERTLNQTLYGVSNLTSEDFGEWEIAANYHANQYLANHTAASLDIQAILRVVSYYVGTGSSSDDSEEWVTIEYTHALLVRQVADGGSDNVFLETPAYNINELVLEPFNNAENKQVFQTLLQERGEFLRDVVSISDVIPLGDEGVSASSSSSPPSPMPTTSPPVVPEAPTRAPSNSAASSRKFVWTTDRIFTATVGLITSLL